MPDLRLHPVLARFVRRDRVAMAIYLALGAQAAAMLVLHDRLWAAVALAPAFLGSWGIVASSALLRLAYVGTGFSDPVVVSEAARDRVLRGGSPYGVGYAETLPPGSPFPYGPLALLDSVPIELIASIALLLLLARARRPLTLALYAGLPFSIVLASAGNNDYVPSLLLASGLLLLPHKRGGVLIALSAVWKPYTVVFVPVAFAAGSIATFIASMTTLIIGWLPALWWGGFMDSLAMLNTLQGPSTLRYLAAPLAAAAFRWGTPAACAAFALLTLTSQTWALGYLIPVGVALGIAVEPPFRSRTPPVSTSGP